MRSALKGYSHPPKTCVEHDRCATLLLKNHNRKVFLSFVQCITSPTSPFLRLPFLWVRHEALTAQVQTEWIALHCISPGLHFGIYLLLLLDTTDNPRQRQGLLRIPHLTAFSKHPPHDSLSDKLSYFNHKSKTKAASLVPEMAISRKPPHILIIGREEKDVLPYT